MVPQPCIALVLLFPITKASEEAREQRMPACAGQHIPYSFWHTSTLQSDQHELWHPVSLGGDTCFVHHAVLVHLSRACVKPMQNSRSSRTSSRVYLTTFST